MRVCWVRVNYARQACAAWHVRVLAVHVCVRVSAVFVFICCMTAFAVCLPLLRIHVLRVLRVCLRVFVSCAACASLK